LDLVQQRDDLSVELCALYNQTGAHEKALALVASRRFQPWEGGEGGPYGQWVRSHLLLGRQALSKGKAALASEHFLAALSAPENLGETKHMLANQSDVHYWLGRALAALGQPKQAAEHWLIAARFKGDFQEMSVRAFSEMTYYSAMSWRELGEGSKAEELLVELNTFGQNLGHAPARIDYFATSLPTMLLFEDDLKFRQGTTALLLQAQSNLGLGSKDKARNLLNTVLERDPNNPIASDLWAEASASNPDVSDVHGLHGNRNAASQARPNGKCTTPIAVKPVSPEPEVLS
jgi:tetratricopeptide (TPR) repeat protein